MVTKGVERVLIVILILAVAIGFFMNFKLKIYLDERVSTQSICDKEKQYLIDSIDEMSKDHKAYEEKLLKEINKTKDDNIKKGKIYCFLGYNSYYALEREKGLEYFIKAMENLKDTEEYIYILNGLDNIMSEYFRRGEYVKALEYAAKIQEILNIEEKIGVSEEGIEIFKANSAMVLTTVGALYGLDKSGETFYNELVDLTEKNKSVENNFTIYAKYQYNMKKKDYKKAEEFAKKYIDNLKGTEYEDAAYVYLAEIFIENKNLSEVPELIKKVENIYAKLEQKDLDATLLNLKGKYYLKMGENKKAYECIKAAIEIFKDIGYDTYAYNLLENIVVNLDKFKGLEGVDNYVSMYGKYRGEAFNKNNQAKIADSFIQTMNKNENGIKIKYQKKIIENISKALSKLNYVYIIIISGLIFCLVKLRGEIKKRRENEKNLQNMLDIDVLTKCYSRKYITSKIEEYINIKKEFTIIMFDLDNFKKINDNFGHPMGDLVLKGVVEESKKVLVDDKGYIGRLGGEEFIIVLKENEDGTEIGQKIKEGILNRIWDIDEIVVTLSGGMVKWNGEEYKEIMSKADKLLYKAKNSGKNKIIKKI